MPIQAFDDGGMIIDGAEVQLARLITLKHAVRLWAVDTKMWPLPYKSMRKTVTQFGFSVPKYRDRERVADEICDQIDDAIEQFLRNRPTTNGDE